MSQTLYVDKGIVRVYDNDTYLVLEVMYSPDGLGNWENNFNPMSHTKQEGEGAGITIIPGHNYMRLRHPGDEAWQLPMKVVAKDGVPVVLANDGTYIKWKLTTDLEYTNLVELETLKGDKGDTGVMGQGLNIKRSGALDVRPLAGTVVPTSGCTSCNNTTPTVSEVCLYLSLGNHVINTDDVLNETTYWHTIDGTNWVQTTDNHLGLFVIGWKATDALNANELGLTCNAQGMVGLFHELPAYNSTGKIYAYSTENLIWTELTNISTETGYAKVSSTDVLQLLEDKLDEVTLTHVNNILEVKDAGIDENKLKTGTFTDGFTQISGQVVKIKPADFGGFGLSTFTNTIDSNVDMQINVTDIVDDGLIVQANAPVNGATTSTIRVNADDLVTGNYGIETITGGDTYKDFKVKIDTAIFEFDSGAVSIKDNAITGVMLNDTTADNTKGIEVLSDKLVAKINPTSLEFNGSGQIGVKDSYVTGLLGGTSDLIAGSNKVSITANNGVILGASDITIDLNLSNIQHDSLGGLPGGNPHTQYVRKDTLTQLGDIYYHDGSTVARLVKGGDGQVLSSTSTTLEWITPAGAVAAYTSIPTTVGTTGADDGSSNAYAKGDHKHNIEALPISTITGLQAELDGGVKFDEYGNIIISATQGIIYKSSTKTWILTVDDQGNIGTSQV